jgi:hypothetical protein
MWPVSFAKRLLPRLGIASLDPIPSNQSADIYGPAPITDQTPRPSLPPLSEQSLHARAIRVCNREPRAIAKYMQTHMSLHRER